MSLGLLMEMRARRVDADAISYNVALISYSAAISAGEKGMRRETALGLLMELQELRVDASSKASACKEHRTHRCCPAFELRHSKQACFEWAMNVMECTRGA